MEEKAMPPIMEIPLDLPEIRIVKTEISEREIVITVEITREWAICARCVGEQREFAGYGRRLRSRPLLILGRPVTKAYDQWLLLALIGSTITEVARKEGTTYDAVLGALRRQIAAEVNWAEVVQLEVLGIDEIALKKGHP